MRSILGFIPMLLILIPLYIGMPALVLYFVIKIAVKKAIIELKDENIL